MQNLIQNTSTKGKIGMGVAAVAVVLVAILLMKMASSPSFTTIASGVDPAQTGKMTSALDQRGIKWKLANNGTGIAVDAGQTATARVALAEQGLPQNGQAGFELFDKQKLGASNLQQQVTYQRALEGELAQTIEQVQGVSSAQVNLVLPEEQLFNDQNSTAKASVLLGTGGQRDGPRLRARHRAARGRRRQGPPAPERVDHRLERPAPLAHRRQPVERSRLGPQAGCREPLRPAARRAPPGDARPDSRRRQGHRAGQRGPERRPDEQGHADLRARRACRSRRRSRWRSSRAPAAPAAARAPARTSRATRAGGSGGNNNYNNTTTDTTYGVNKEVAHTKVAPGALQQARCGGACGQVRPARPGGPAPVRARRGRGHQTPSAATPSR